MIRRILLVVATTSFFAACSGITSVTQIDLVLKNRSVRDVENARVEFANGQNSWGYAASGATKIVADYQGEISSSADLSWRVGGQSKKQVVNLAEVLRQAKRGELVFIIRDDLVEVEFIKR